MSGLVKPSGLGTLAGIVTFIGIALTANEVDRIFDFDLLQYGGVLVHWLWLAFVPCLIAGIVAATRFRVSTARTVLAAVGGAAVGCIASFVAFNQLEGMQGLNPFLFSGPFTAAVIAAVASRER